MAHCETCDRVWDAPWDACDCPIMDKCDNCDVYFDEDTLEIYNGLRLCPDCLQREIEIENEMELTADYAAIL